MDEIWKDIPGYEGRYQASTLGRIRSGDKIKSQFECKTRGNKHYFRCAIYGRPMLVHRLIALTFIPNLENKKQVDHIDFNEQNNNVDNLRWVTVKENQQHSAGRMRNKKSGSDHCRSLLTSDERNLMYDMIALGIKATKIAKHFGVKPNTIHAILYRDRKYESRPKLIGEC